MSDFVHHEMFPLGPDATEYRKLTSDHVGTSSLAGRDVLTIDIEALRLLSAKKSAAEASGILDMPEVRAFVERHYAEDARIHRAVTARSETLKAALQADDLPGDRTLAFGT